MSHSTAATIGHDRNMEDILDRELYSEPEAARLLRLGPSALHWWLEGGERRGRTYRPVLRVEPTGSRLISWAEFVEAGLLRQYRRVHQVPLPQLRRMIDRLRQRWGAHPLVHEQPYVGPVGGFLSRPRTKPESRRNTSSSRLLAAGRSSSRLQKRLLRRSLGAATSRCGGARMRTLFPRCA